MEYTLKENIIITDADEVVRRVQALSGCPDVSMEKIASFCLSEVATMFYIDEKLNVSCEENAGFKALYLWIDTGYVSDIYKQPIFISLVNKDGYYTGYYVGEAKGLSRMMADYFPKHKKYIVSNLSKFKYKYDVKTEKRTLKHYLPDEEETTLPKSSVGNAFADKLSGFKSEFPAVSSSTEQKSLEDAKEDFFLREDYRDNSRSFTEVTQSLWDMLLIKHWDDAEGLDYYIKICGNRLYDLVKKNKSQYYILNNIKSAVINTGLLNQFGQDILVLYRLHLKTESYQAYKIIEGKADLLSNDFTREQVSVAIEPISFLEEEDVFDADSIDDFDINYHSLIHILRERKDRFPDLPEQQLAEKLKNAITLGVTIANRDKSFVKASYSSKQGSFSWLLPLHIERNFAEEPELVMVIVKRNGFYEVKTILPYDETVKDRITALSLYSKIW